jgi:hypothetical protein
MMKMIVFKFLEIGHIEMIMILQAQGNRTIRFNEIKVHGWKIMYAVGKRVGEKVIFWSTYD